MQIEEVEIHEFTYEIEDVSPRPNGEIVYVPGGSIEPPGYVLTIRTDTGLEGYYRAPHVDEDRRRADQIRRHAVPDRPRSAE